MTMPISTHIYVLKFSNLLHSIRGTHSCADLFTVEKGVNINKRFMTQHIKRGIVPLSRIELFQWMVGVCGGVFVYTKRICI